MDIASVITAIKQHPHFAGAGMVLCHNGVVRQTSRDGRRVTGLRVKVDHDRLQEIIRVNKQREGIVDIRVQIAEDSNLRVGDDVMLLAVAGDIRDNVIPVLSDTLDAIKSTVTTKTEFYEDEQPYDT